MTRRVPVGGLSCLALTRCKQHVDRPTACQALSRPIQLVQRVGTSMVDAFCQDETYGGDMHNLTVASTPAQA